MPGSAVGIRAFGARLAALLPPAPVVAALLGALYVPLAFCWPWLFHREELRHAFREELGYRLGLAIFWRPPFAQAAAVAALAAVPLLARRFLPARAAGRVAWGALAALAAYWLLLPPGLRYGIVAIPMRDGTTAQALVEATGPVHAVSVFLLLGLLPALLGGRLLEGTGSPGTSAGGSGEKSHEVNG